MNRHLNWMILLGLLLFSLTGNAQSNKVMKVLWVGNSFTFYNDMPTMVRDIAATQNVKLSITKFLKGGERFAGHLTNEKLIEALQNGGWDYVILQGFSSTPAYSTRSVIEDVYPYAHTLDSLAKAHSPMVKVIYYMTWGHKNGNVRQTTYPLDDNFDLMQERLKISYLEMAHENDSWCAPVGMAWQELRHKHPEFELYQKDNFHPSVMGSYLAANVIFSTIYQKYYKTYYTAKLPSWQANVIQRLAQETVLNNLRLLNIYKL